VASHRSKDPRYGWVLVAGGMVSIGFQAAIFFATALLLVAIPDDTGWSRASTAAALSSLVLGSGAWSPIVGALLQRWGPRRVMFASGLVTAAGLVALSLARSPEELAAAMLLLISPGTTGLGSLAIYTALQEWFRERRGTALSIADSGASLGLMVLVPLIQQLILGFGWRAACLVLASAALSLAVMHLVIQRPAPVRALVGASADGVPERSAGLVGMTRQPRVWLIGLGLAASRFAFQLIAIHQVAYLNDQGFDLEHLASVFALTGLAGLAGRPGFCWLSDRIGVTPVYALLTGCLLFGIGSLIVAGQSGLVPALWLFAVSFGAALGVGTLLFARQVSDAVGSRSFGSALGFASALGSLGGAGGATAAGLVYDATGTYLTSFAAAAIMALVAHGCMWALGLTLRRPTPLPGPPERSPS
jgi:OFA family oxalate/formate antiporter-like MFS transporter